MHQASTAPGTVTACGLGIGISRNPRSTYHSTFAFAGARPEPFNATGGPPFGEYSTKQSPPMPVLCGSATHCTATAAIAASTALPPERSTSSAVNVANWFEVAAMPLAATAADRPVIWKSRIYLYLSHLCHRLQRSLRSWIPHRWASRLSGTNALSYLAGQF